MEKYKKVLEEDECAPDAGEYFEKEMKEKYSLSFDDFKTVDSGDDSCIMKMAEDGKYKLEYWGDFPYWTLYERTN